MFVLLLVLAVLAYLLGHPQVAKVLAAVALVLLIVALV